MYTLAIATLMGTLVGVTQRFLGSPGDLPEVVHQIHTSGRIAISQAPSMFVCSAFSIAAGELQFHSSSFIFEGREIKTQRQYERKRHEEGVPRK